MGSGKGYYRHPTVSGSRVVFVSEDDLWTVSLAGGVARRLTTGLGACSNPAFSPDGKWIAFSSAEEGHREVFVMPSEGGPLRRLTYLGNIATVTGWQSNETILFRTDALDCLDMDSICTVSLDGGLPKSLMLGPAISMTVNERSGAIVLERNSWRSDPAHWKRYRGGTAGKFYKADSIDGEFRPFLRNLTGNLARPIWMGDRLYFVSDHENVGNLYSCTADGSDVRRLTEFHDYYVRNPSSDGKALVFHAGADLYRFDPGLSKAEKIEIEFTSQRVQRQRKFVKAEAHLESYSLSEDGLALCLTTRGQVAAMGNWHGPTTWPGRKDGVRYRLGCWIDQDRKILMTSDESGEERLMVFDFESRTSRLLEDADFGRAALLRPSPDGKWAAIVNHRSEVVVVDLVKGVVKDVVSKSEYGYGYQPVSWSPDSRYLAYVQMTNFQSSSICVYDTRDAKSHVVTEPFLVDTCPVFDPGGKYLYFISDRELNPVYDEMAFDLGFHETSLICLVTLRRSETSPLLAPLKPQKEEDEDGSKSKKKDSIQPIEIDFEGITDRIVRLPAEPAKYLSLAAAKGKVFFSSVPIEGALGPMLAGGAPKPKNELHVFDLEKRKAEVFLSGISSFALSGDHSRMAVQIGGDLRVVKVDEKPKEDKPSEECTAETGWVDLDRVKVLVEPPAEWRQMFREVWRLQRDHFWREDMSKIQWREVFETYLPLLDRVGVRSEFGDLIWEMQGELGTSHAYEVGGDYRAEPKYHVGLLGARFEWDPKAGAYRIERIWQGDSWNPQEACPLRSPGVLAEEGDWITSVQGRRLTETCTPYEALMNLAAQEVEITLRRKLGKSEELHRVRTLREETIPRYRTWVDNNRAFVHEKSGGRLGYIHIPDMGPRGYAEFHRHFLREFDRDGLVVDLRFNGGGHVSQLLLEKLARKRIGFDQARWIKPAPYPGNAPAGPMVALTNEYAGSDGDIFSHAFKLMKLGPLVGTRTWGGVIGISPRHRLVDGGVTTQPEYSHWFVDVGWGVENYGTDPDIVVEDLPHEYRRGEDRQLDRAVQEAMARLETHPPFRPVVTTYPDLGVSGLKS